jgi:23S rRNA (pseudouridine1915-N3)-methyltransferase
VLEKEGQRIIKKIPKSSSVITLCIEGKEYSSPDFSKLIENISMTSSSICFIIGGSFGLSDEIKKLSNYPQLKSLNNKQKSLKNHKTLKNLDMLKML